MRRLLFAVVLACSVSLPLSSATVDGLKLHSTVTGSGPTLIFVHGWTCDSTSWAGQVPALSKKYRVVILDLPGHGRSGSPAAGTFSMDLFAKAVEAVRHEAKADKIVLVGHSMGAPVIRQYARRYPQHVAALVAVDGPLDMSGFNFQPPPVTGPEGLKTRETMIKSMFSPQTSSALQRQILAMMLRAPEATAGGAMQAMLDPSIRQAEPTPVPALAVYAGTAQMPDVAAMKKHLPAFEATQIAGTGHFLMMEKPEEFNRTLTAFLEKIKY
jgi:pimeloyl-ACP methyl ester carboxylesterase